MVKIVHFGKYYPPDRGGIESVTESVAKAAVQAGYDVNAICFDKSGNGGEDALIDGVRINRYLITKMLNTQPLSFIYFWNCVRRGHQADVVHLHFPNLLASLAALFLSRKTKLIVHWHSDIIGKGRLGHIVAPIEKAMLERADVVLATSQRYVDGSVRLQPYTHKISVVPLGVDDIPSSQPKMNLPQRFAQFLKGRPFVLSVGRLTAYKGFSVLIDAAKKLPDDVVIIIAGDGELKNELLAQISRFQLETKIFLAGRVSDEELVALYQQAQLFCLPSNIKSEAFGVVLMEAMAYSLPIVATEIPGSGVPWVNAHGVSGINVPVNDSSSMADAIEKLLKNKELRQSLSIGARRRFEENFTAKHSCECTLAIYRKILSN